MSELVIKHRNGVIRLLQWEKLTIEKFMSYLDGKKDIEITIIKD